MSERLKVVSTAEEAAWTDVLSRAFCHDVFHHCHVHRAAEANGEGTASLFHYQEGDYSIAVPLLICPINGQPDGGGTRAAEWYDATSVYGYCGPMASHAEVPASVQFNFRSALHEALLERRVVSVFSRLHPLIQQADLLRDMGDCEVVGPTVSIDLRLPPDRLWSQYRENHKRDIKRLRRMHIQVERDADLRHLDRFIALYYETMRRVGASPEYFFPRSHFESILLHQRQHSHLFVCTQNQNVICAGLFTLNDGLVQYYLAGTSGRYAKYSPPKLLIDGVRLWAAGEQCHTLHLGGGLGAKQDSLYRFKTGFSRRTHWFSVWKWILRHDVYDRLSREKARHGKEAGLRPLTSDYFPPYRACYAPQAAEAVLSN